ERKFNALAEGGSLNMPFGKTFFSKGFGMCFDQFGIPWMVNSPLEGM
ncbi:MAG: VOC family protein, partial [Bradyrhizobium sp.]